MLFEAIGMKSTEQVNKIALSLSDDKRVILENRVHTLAYGHYSLIF